MSSLTFTLVVRHHEICLPWSHKVPDPATHMHQPKMQPELKDPCFPLPHEHPDLVMHYTSNSTLPKTWSGIRSCLCHPPPKGQHAVMGMRDWFHALPLPQACRDDWLPRTSGACRGGPQGTRWGGCHSTAPSPPSAISHPDASAAVTGLWVACSSLTAAAWRHGAHLTPWQQRSRDTNLHWAVTTPEDPSPRLPSAGRQPTLLGGSRCHPATSSPHSGADATACPEASPRPARPRPPDATSDGRIASPRQRESTALPPPLRSHRPPAERAAFGLSPRGRARLRSGSCVAGVYHSRAPPATPPTLREEGPRQPQLLAQPGFYCCASNVTSYMPVQSETQLFRKQSMAIFSKTAAASLLPLHCLKKSMVLPHTKGKHEQELLALKLASGAWV